jgi:hypothetical protein
MTEGFWLWQAPGLFFAEYPLVIRGVDRATRLVDGLILPDEPMMYLMGQALFSARLAVSAGAASVRSILLCHKSDAALLPLLEPFPEVEVWLSDPTNPHLCSRPL